MDLSFYNQVIATLVETYGIKHILGTPHYPQSHGFIKRQHQGIIIFFFKKLPSTNPWYHYLSTTLALLGRSHTSEIHYNSCTRTPAITRRVICFPFRFDQLRQRLYNHLFCQTYDSISKSTTKDHL